MNLTLERPVTFMEEKIGHPICLSFALFDLVLRLAMKTWIFLLFLQS